jgi:hypothetical protein
MTRHAANTSVLLQKWFQCCRVCPFTPLAEAPNKEDEDKKVKIRNRGVGGFVLSKTRESWERKSKDSMTREESVPS